MSDQYGGRASYAGRLSFGKNSTDRDTDYNSKGSMRIKQNRNKSYKLFYINLFKL